jgi:Xaa-Pro aminopeptidase
MISAAEHRQRRERLAKSLADAGLDGAIVVSRGGSTFDRFANVFYLTGHYQSYSYLPDYAPLFSARAHTVLALSSEGRDILCVSVPEYDSVRVHAGDVRHSHDFISTLIGALDDLGLRGRRLGLIGADVVPAHYWLQLTERFSVAAWTECDDLIDGHRRVKSKTEQDLVRQAAAIHRRATTALVSAAAPGVSEADLVAIFAQSVMSQGGGIYFTALSSGDGNARWASTALPGFGQRRLAKGDLLRFDTGIVYEGYLSDFGRTIAIGGLTDRQDRLLGVLHRGLDAAIAAIVPGAKVKEIVRAGEASLAADGVGDHEDGTDRIVSSFPVHWGHGLGLGWERPWMTETEELTIQPGMVLAIERALRLPGVGTAAAEQNILVLDQGTELLTGGPQGRWT